MKSRDEKLAIIDEKIEYYRSNALWCGDQIEGENEALARLKNEMPKADTISKMKTIISRMQSHFESIEKYEVAAEQNREKMQMFIEAKELI